MLITLEPLGIFCSKDCPTAGMRNGYEASARIILVGLALLVKMLITLEPRASFGTNFLYLHVCI